MNIREAKLNGIRGAAEVHQRLGIIDYLKEGIDQIDVFQALSNLDIPTLCRPLDGLLGAYINSESKGVLITTKRRLPIQRFTAAHELGHVWLKHEESLDSEQTIGLARQGVATVPLQEIEAEAFASEFLLPKLLIVQTAKKQGWRKSDLSDPKVVYQLALRTGTSYEASWRALLENNLITHKAAEFIRSKPPKEAKESVLGDIIPDDYHLDVFKLTSKDNGLEIKASPEDIIVLELQEHSNGGYLWSDLYNYPSLKLIKDQSFSKDSNNIGGSRVRKYVFQGAGKVELNMEEKRPWEKSSAPIDQVDLNLDFNGKEIGLPKACR